MIHLGVERLKHYVIIGAGPAGATAAETLRKLDTDSKITAITDEEFTHYKREHIIDIVSDDKTEDELYTKGKNFYDDINVELLHAKVSKILSEKNKLVLADSSTIEYNTLLIASGGTPIVPAWSGVNLEGISTLYTLADAKKLQQFVKKSNHLVIIGGGSIALKAIPLLRKFPQKITLIEKLNHLWPCMLDRKASVLLEKKIIADNVDLLLNQEVIGFKGENGHVNSILLRNNTSIPADLVLVTIGIRVNFEYLKDSGLKTDFGIITDDYLRTNISNIYAAGDVAQVPDPLYGTPILHPTWSNAEEQGEIAAHNMVMRDKKYPGAIPLHTTRFYDLEIVAAGITQPELESQFTLRENFEEISKISVDDNFYRKFILKDDRIIGLILIEKNINRKLLKKLFKKILLKGKVLSIDKLELLKTDFDFNSILD